MLSGFLESLTRLPLMARFALAMAVILVVPALCRKVRLPSVVGLLLAGVVFGPNGLHVGPRSHEVAHFFADVGKLLLMFFAGLEIDLVLFRRTGHRSLAFGLATFALPLAGGVLAGLGFGYGWLAALLIGSLLASHTLLGYPIVQRLGLARDEAVTVTVGATLFTDVASLMILAVCIPIHVAGFSPTAFLAQLAELAVYVPVVVFGLGRLTEWLMPKVKTKEGQFLVMLLVVAIAAVGAEAIHLEGIIGAFLAGLALNRAVEESRAKHELEFLGNTLFIPMSFITVGFLIDEPVLNSVIVLMVVTSVLGPILTELFGKRLKTVPDLAPPAASELAVISA